jgi:hypothetical protein
VSTEGLVSEFARQINRRRFLKRVGASVLGALVAALGIPTTALATIGCKCCNLCSCPGGCGACQGSSHCSGCTCTWCWTCFDPPSGNYYRCCECNSDSVCENNCIGVICSYWYKINVLTSPAPPSQLPTAPAA